MNLKSNKKLTISIAINLMLILVCLMLLYLVYPQFLYELDSVTNWSRYSVRTYRKYEGGMAYFEVLMGPKEYLKQPKFYRRIYSLSGKQAFYVELFGNDITGDDLPNLVIRQWLGSAHGDSKYHVLEIDNSVVNQIDVIDGLFDVKSQDLNNDGTFEFTGKDRSYSYFCGYSYAGSPRPTVILSFDKTQGKFIVDRKLMSKRPLSNNQLTRLIFKYKDKTLWHKNGRPPSELFVNIFELIYSGNEKQAWDLFYKSWPDEYKKSKEQYVEAIENNLRNSPFYSDIDD